MKNSHVRWDGWLLLVSVLLMAGCETEIEQRPAGLYNAASSDGFPIRYELAGEGDTALVFVHCWSCDRSFWDGQFNHFASEYRVVRLDLVGHGESGKGRRGNTMAKYGSDVANTVEELGLTRVILIGHSMGGPVVVDAAKLLGDRVIGVIGVDTFYTSFVYPKDDADIAAFVKPFETDFSAALTQMVQTMFAPEASPALKDRVIAVMNRADRRTAVESMYDVFYWSRDKGTAALAALGGRLRNINGDPSGEAQPLNSSVTLVKGAGHFPHMEQRAAFNAELKRIVRDFDQSEP